MNLQWVYSIIITCVLGIIAYFLKETKKGLDEKIKDVVAEICKVKTDASAEINKVKEEFNQFKSEMPLVYVLRDDFIRAMGNVEKKLDKIYDLLSHKRKDEDV